MNLQTALAARFHGHKRHTHHRPHPRPHPHPGPTPSPSPSGNIPSIPGGVPRGETMIDAVVTIDKYEGVASGPLGLHEHAEGHITVIKQINDKTVVDTEKVFLAMNVRSSKDKAGLPQEVPLTVGQQIEVEGVYIPEKIAKDRPGEAVIHWTHAPAGWVEIDGKKYA